jgi:radical SAM superfamily enzyme YgiQ (UPF0313 family)
MTALRHAEEDRIMRIVLPTLHVRPSAQAVPLAAGCLKAALPEALRDRTRLLDLFPQQSDDEMLSAVLAAAPDLVAFPLYAWNRRRICELARRLRQARPILWLVAGGPELLANPQAALAEGGFDAVIVGEGEERFRDLAVDLAEGNPLRPGKGLVLPDEGAPPTAEPASSARDELPSPWLSGALTPTAEGGVLWETSRGCPFACAFCFDARGSRGLRPMPFARLEAELELFVRQRASQVWVLDSTFNHPPERGKKLLRLLARKAPHIHFHLEAKADFLDRETARLLAKLSCSVQVGLQSARPEVLRHIHRGLDPREFSRKIQLLGKEGVTFGLDLIYGLPGDDYQGFRQSLDFALALSPNHLDIFPLAVLPGTELHRAAAEHGIRAQIVPPYEILESASCGADDLEKCRRLAAAADLFYNTGRAVGFFAALLKVADLDGASFLEDFADWALRERQVPREHFLDGERWRSNDALQLQEGYLAWLLKRLGRLDLLPAAQDLLRYHFHYAETLLGVETLPATPEALRGVDPWQSPLRLAEGVRLVPFTYEILDLLEMGEAELEEIAGLFRPIGSVAVFLRRGDQVLCESLEEDFLKLLRGADGRRSPAAIFAGTVTRAEGEEIVRFALAEGFLIPAA